MKFARQTDAKFRQSERRRNPRMHELPEVLAGAALDNFRDYPEARGRMVLVLAADGPFEPPFRESFETLTFVKPLILRIGRVRKSADVEQHLFDGYVLFIVGPELRDDVRDPLARFQFAFADQNPRRRRHDRLGARKNRVESLVGRGLFLSTLAGAPDSAHRADFSVARDRNLGGRQQAVADFALGALEQRLDFFRIETYFAWIFCEMILRRHEGSPMGGGFAFSGYNTRNRIRHSEAIRALPCADTHPARPRSVERMTSHAGSSARSSRDATSR